MKLTRRELVAAVSITAAAQAQSPQKPAAADELQAARERLKANTDQVAQQQLPMATEPAFQFKA